MIEITTAASEADFEAAAELIRAMAAWDAQETEAAGFPGAEMLETYYGHVQASLSTSFSPAIGGLLLARSDGIAAGCIAFLCRDDIGRIDKLFVSPEHRGKRVGNALVSAALEKMALRGTKKVRLATATFMQGAQALYRSFGFTECPPFEETSEASRGAPHQELRTALEGRRPASRFGSGSYREGHSLRDRPLPRYEPHQSTDNPRSIQTQSIAEKRLSTQE
jgi:ribosomal protein S18 acetylase RimI-like enzyme